MQLQGTWEGSGSGRPIQTSRRQPWPEWGVREAFSGGFVLRVRQSFFKKEKRRTWRSC